MKRYLPFLIFVFTITYFLPVSSAAQGVSVSYLIPQNGLLSAPVSPFSVRGIRLPITDFAGLQTGGTLYIFPGLPMSELPFESDAALRGSTFGVIAPLEAYLGFGSSQFKMILSGGVFGLGFLNRRIDQGAWDGAYAGYRGWELANGDLSLENNLGWGWITGISLEVPINRKYAVTMGVNYLSGSSSSPVSGSVTGYSTALGLVNETIAITDSKTMLRGIELSFGVSF